MIRLMLHRMVLSALGSLAGEAVGVEPEALDAEALGLLLLSPTG